MAGKRSTPEQVVAPLCQGSCPASGYDFSFSAGRDRRDELAYQPVDKIGGCTQHHKMLGLKALYGAICSTAHEAAAFCQRAVNTAVSDSGPKCSPINGLAESGSII